MANVNITRSQIERGSLIYCALCELSQLHESVHVYFKSSLIFISSQIVIYIFNHGQGDCCLCSQSLHLFAFGSLHDPVLSQRLYRALVQRWYHLICASTMPNECATPSIAPLIQGVSKNQGNLDCYNVLKSMSTTA